MESCCRLGAELVKKDNVLFETDNFFGVPTIGPIGIEGYLLLCSKEHYIGIGGVPEEHRSELEDVLKMTRDLLSDFYGSEVLVFEHGPRVGCHKGGGCLDHAHLHIVPVSVNLMEPLVLQFLKALAINDYYKLERTEGFERLTQIVEDKKVSYLFVETADRRRFTTEVNFVIPSQYLRQIIASQLGRLGDYDWRLVPDHETFNRTVENLKGRF